jgi:signal peptidase II
MHDDPGPAEPTSHDPPAAPAAPHADPVASSADPVASTADPVAPRAAPSQLADTLIGVPRVDVTAPPPPTLPSFMQPAAPAGSDAPAQPLAAHPFAGGQPLQDHERASTTFLVVVSVISLAADLVTKGWAKGRLSALDGKGHALRRLPVWKDHLEFVFAQNPGGAWSFLRGLPDTLRRPFFLVVSAAAIVFIITIYRRIHRDQWAMRWGLPLALGGAIGNLVDRIRYGWVVDFIDFSMKWGGKDHHWPTFNVADIAIVVGVALMGMDMLRHRRHHAGDHVAHAPAA